MAEILGKNNPEEQQRPKEKPNEGARHDFSEDIAKSLQDKPSLVEKLTMESDELIDASNTISEKLAKELQWVDKILEKYTDITKVPKNKKNEILQRVSRYMALRKTHEKINRRLVSIGTSFDLMGHEPKKQQGDTEKRDWKKVIIETKQEADNSKFEAENIARFLQIKDTDKENAESQPVSQLNVMLILEEANKNFQKKYEGTMDPVSVGYDEMGRVLETLQKGQNDPEFLDKKNLKIPTLFEKAERSIDKLLLSINASRQKFKEMKDDLNSELMFNVLTGNTPILKIHPELKDIYAKILENAVKQIDTILDNPESPISTEQIGKIENSKVELKKTRHEHAMGTLKNIAAFIVITATAVVGGMAGAYLIAGVLKTSSIFITSIGMSAGGVVGSRMGMEITNKTGLSEHKDIWDAKKMGRDFVVGYGLSVGALLAGKTMISALKTASLSENAATAARASAILAQVQKLKFLTSPFERIHSAKKILGEFGVKVGEEIGEEMAEEGAERIHPVLGFFATLINASDGTNVKLNMARVNTKKVGIEIEGKNFVYNTKTPQEFLSNLKKHFAGMQGSSFDATINADGTIDISIYGQKLNQSIASLKISPKTAKVETAQPETAQAKAKHPEKLNSRALKTTQKIQEISSYLKENAKELFKIFNKRLSANSSAGIFGAQIFQIMTDTVAEFAGAPATLERQIRKLERQISKLERVSPETTTESEIQDFTLNKLREELKKKQTEHAKEKPETRKETPQPKQESKPELPLATILGGEEGHEIRKNGDYQALTFTSGGEQKYHENQDSVYANAEQGAIAAVDGMGGHKGGRQASGEVTTAINDGIIQGLSTKEIINDAHARVTALEGKDPGTTMAMVRTMKLNGKYYLECTNIGDAQIIILHPQRGILYISRDQSRVQRLYEEGVLKDPLDRYTHIENNKISNGIIKNLSIKAPGQRTLEVPEGTYAFTMSDGISDFVSPEEVFQIVQRYGKEAPLKIKELSESRQLKQGGFDIKLHGDIRHAEMNSGDNIAIAMMIVGGENPARSVPSHLGREERAPIYDATPEPAQIFSRESIPVYHSPNERLRPTQIQPNTENIYQNRGMLGIQFGRDPNLYISLDTVAGHLRLNLNTIGGQVLYLTPGQEITLGRDNLGGHSRISGRHVKIKYLQDGSISVTDLGSSNGTVVF